MEAVFHAVNPWWEGRPVQSGVTRAAYTDRLLSQVDRRAIEILVGSRRVGKTTLLKQVVSGLLAGGASAHDLCYLPLDHPALSRTPISEHLKTFRRLFDHPRDRRLVLFLDEVQDSPDWQNELKAIYDTESLKFYCSGSSATLITRQGDKLTGRALTTVVSPLSFPEFLDFRGGRPSLADDHRYERLADDYLQTGGYPEHVLSPQPEYLPELLNGILARDLVRLYPIKKPAALRDLFGLVAASVGHRTSFNRLAKVLGLSLDTAKEYLGYLEAAWLTAPLAKWSESHSDRVYAQKKLYLLDPGFKTICTGSGDEGARAENAVFVALHQRGLHAGYFAESEREVDFVLGTPTSPLPIEVKLLDRVDPTDRRLAGLALFARRYPKARRALLITRTAQANVPFHGMELQAVPLWRFLLEPERYVAG